MSEMEKLKRQTDYIVKLANARHIDFNTAFSLQVSQLYIGYLNTLIEDYGV